jgi:hypothetical protein
MANHRAQFGRCPGQDGVGQVGFLTVPASRRSPQGVSIATRISCSEALGDPLPASRRSAIRLGNRRLQALEAIRLEIGMQAPVDCHQAREPLACDRRMRSGERSACDRLTIHFRAGIPLSRLFEYFRRSDRQPRRLAAGLLKGAATACVRWSV